MSTAHVTYLSGYLILNGGLYSALPSATALLLFRLYMLL